MRHVIFMAHSGLHFGEYRGHHPPGPPNWREPAYPYAHTHSPPPPWDLSSRGSPALSAALSALCVFPACFFFRARWVPDKGVIQPAWWEAAMHGWFMPGKDLRVPNAGWFMLSGNDNKFPEYGKARGRRAQQACGGWMSNS